MNINDIFEDERKNTIIMQGLPGSGKSTFVNKLLEHFKGEVCSADYYFESEDGYNFDKSLIEEAHRFCGNKFVEHVMKNVNLIIVDNTNLNIWEMHPYVWLSKLRSRRCIIIRMVCDLQKSIERNIHNVPVSTLSHMNKRMESIRKNVFPFYMYDVDVFEYDEEKEILNRVEKQIKSTAEL